MKRTLIASAVTAVLAVAPAWAAADGYETQHTASAAAPLQLAQAATPQPPQGGGPGMMGQGMGPGMMGQGYGPGMMGQGMGPGMMGQGYGPGMMGQGMGPGMMGPGYGPGMMGQGMGPGMMGQGMGPGMMGQGYGPGMMGQGMGPGMMGQGYGPGMMGQGMGPGMMGQGYGPGMMYGANPYTALDLSDAQRSKIDEIQQELWRKRWDLMGKMHEERYHMHRWTSGAAPDDAAARKAYEAMAGAHKQMFEATLDARKRIDAVLTKEQRDKLKSGG
jgi:Spy/CpxP family protein refolding chaperone